MARTKSAPSLRAVGRAKTPRRLGELSSDERRALLEAPSRPRLTEGDRVLLEDVVLAAERLSLEASPSINADLVNLVGRLGRHSRTVLNLDVIRYPEARS